MHLHYSEKTSTSNQTQMQLSYFFYSQLFRNMFEVEH